MKIVYHIQNKLLQSFIGQSLWRSKIIRDSLSYSLLTEDLGKTILIKTKNT